jgi:putative acetyltransferase
MPHTGITIRPVPWDHADSIYLRALQRTEINALGGCEPGTAPSAADVPVFVIAYRDGKPVGCGGLRPLSASSAEVKRMFVDPGHRGPVQGSSDSVAGLLLARLEKDAVARGWMELLLETGTFLVSARRFYERCGFVECDLFGGYTEAENSVCYRKEL